MQRYFDKSSLHQIWIYAWPTVIYSLLEISVGLVDIFFASYLGQDAVASIGFARQIFLVLMIGTLAISTGTITLISQHFGAKRYDRASSVAYHALWLAIASGIVFGIVGFYIAGPSMALLGATGMTKQFGTDYLQVLLGGVVFLLVNFTTNAIFRALGDTKTPLAIAFFVNTLNAVFDYLFMFGFWFVPAMEVEGIAVGTVLARSIGAVAAIWILMDGSRRIRIRPGERFNKTIVRNLLRIGLPSGMAGFLRNAARLIFFRILASASASTAVMAAASIGFQIRLFAIMPSLAFQVATSALVGQAIGNKRLDQAESYGWTSITFCTVLFAMVSLFLAAFPHWIIRIFSDDPAMMEIGVFTLRFIAMEKFSSSISIISGGALAGAGDTKPSFYYTIISQWMIMLPLAMALALPSMLNVYGAWIAWGTAPIVQTILTVIRFANGHWKTIKVH